MKQQTTFFKSRKYEHGGILSVGKRRSRRPLSTKAPLHVTLRSEFAYGSRSLLKNKTLIRVLLNKASRLFGVRVYRYAICGNHLHLLIKGNHREDLQNFFRVFCGHTAQQILQQFPISRVERLRVEKFLGGAPKFRAGGAPKADQRSIDTNKQAKASKATQSTKPSKDLRKFWALLVYSRIVTWGREFKIVTKYIEQNVLEALNMIAYKPRKSRFSTA